MPIYMIITMAAIAGITAPVYGAPPVTTVTETIEYTATISWNTNPERFAASTVYTATITITPKTGYTLTGVSANFFTVAGATATNSANAGVVSAVFPATGATLRDLVIADFNAASRQISVKLEIYFDGIANTPLTVTKADYLISADWDEKATEDNASNNLTGEIAPGELTFDLYNDGGLFCPTNTTGAYYTLIKKGVPIKLFIKIEFATETVNWLQLGIYYVTDWVASVTSPTASVVANDTWLNVLSSPSPYIEIFTGAEYQNKAVNTFLTNVFTAMGFTATISAALTRVIPYAFTAKEAKTLFNDLAISDFAAFYTDPTGVLIVDTYLGTRTTRTTITDADQINSAKTEQSINKVYEGVELTYVLPQIKGAYPEEAIPIIDVSGVIIPANTAFYKVPRITKQTGPYWYFRIVDWTPGTVSFAAMGNSSWQTDIYFANNTANPITIHITASASILKLTEVTIADESSSLYRVTSVYIQSDAYAATYKAILETCIQNRTPSLTLEIRGNPLLKVMDRITAQSDTYALTYDGIIQRLKYKYNGSLSCEMTLVNYAMFGGA